jgi:hypothetical protein
LEERRRDRGGWVIGTVVEGHRYFAGASIDEAASTSIVQWHDELFEIADANTKRRRVGTRTKPGEHLADGATKRHRTLIAMMAITPRAGWAATYHTSDRPGDKKSASEASFRGVITFGISNTEQRDIWWCSSVHVFFVVNWYSLGKPYKPAPETDGRPHVRAGFSRGRLGP